MTDDQAINYDLRTEKGSQIAEIQVDVFNFEITGIDFPRKF
jgi:hypothetical protein